MVFELLLWYLLYKHHAEFPDSESIHCLLLNLFQFFGQLGILLAELRSGCQSYMLLEHKLDILGYLA